MQEIILLHSGKTKKKVDVFDSVEKMSEFIHDHVSDPSECIAFVGARREIVKFSGVKSQNYKLVPSKRKGGCCGTTK